MPRLPSVYVKRCCGSSKVTYLDRTKAIDQLRLLAVRLVESNREVLEVWLFGSLARFEAVPGSDADILIVLQDHALPRWFDRIPEFSRAFADTDMPVEVFPYTREETRQLEESGSGLPRAAKSGMLLAAHNGKPCDDPRRIDASR